MPTLPQTYTTEASTRAILEALPDATLLVDDHGITVDCNAKAIEVLNEPASEIIGCSPQDFVHIGNGRDVAVAKLIHANPNRPIPCRVPRNAGRRYEVRVAQLAVSIVPLHWLVMLHDVTDREFHEARLRESLKMEAVRSLAGHVANNFNNALAAISGYLETSSDHITSDPHGATIEIQSARREVRRAARLVRQLQRVSEPTPGKRRPVNLRTLVDDCVIAARAECPDSISFTTSYHHEDAIVLIDQQQIGDVLASFIQNARDAMPDGGTISFDTSIVTAAANDPVPLERSGTEFVRITIKDDGRGMTAETLPRIFEPFFTTKPRQGAGLGLAGVYDALKSHEGGIAVESTPGVGTVFAVYLPRSHSSAPSRPVPAAQGGDETILVVDDELSVRRILRKALQHQGYRVLEASDGDEGLDVYDEHRGDVNLVILDIMMPKMSGWDVYDALQERGNAPPVIIQTGYSSREREDIGRVAEGFLRKPYDLTELVTTVREILDGDNDSE